MAVFERLVQFVADVASSATTNAANTCSWTHLSMPGPGGWDALHRYRYANAAFIDEQSLSGAVKPGTETDPLAPVDRPRVPESPQQA